MLDLSVLSLNRNPIAKVRIFFEITNGCSEFSVVFSSIFSEKQNTHHSGAILCLNLRSVSSPLQVRFRSVPRNGLRAKAQRIHNGGRTKALQSFDN